MLSNVVAKIDAKDNIYPRKEKPEQKIDGIVAAIMGVARAMNNEESIDDFINSPISG
jgi:phage terminase large subunit-like protein